MKRSGLKRKTPLKASKGLERRTPIRPVSERRQAENVAKGRPAIGRECDRLTLGGEPVGTKRWPVEPDRIVTLCRSRGLVKGCHELYDDHESSILSVLTLAEQLQAVRDAGGIELARKRLSPTDYENGVAKGVAV